MKFTKTDEQATLILSALYRRGYSFADIFDYYNGIGMKELLSRKIYKDLKEVKKYNKCNIEKNVESYNLILSNTDKRAELIKQLNEIIDQFTSLELLKVKQYNLALRLKNYINEINTITSNEYEELIVPKRIKNTVLYKSMENQDYKILQKNALSEDYFPNKI